MPERLNERLGRPALPRPAGPLAWVHAASVGELVSVLPLIGLLGERGLAVLVTTGTVTSATVAAQRLPESAFHQFAPIDTPGAARRFVAHWRPDLAIFVESELWPNLIVAAHKAGARLALVNGRLSERSATGWGRAPKFIRAVLSRFSPCLMQTEGDAARLASLGAGDARCLGNLKFDAADLAADAAALADMRRAIGSRPVFIAASTHPGEEEIVIAAHLGMAQALPGLLTVLAPRHPNRGDSIAAMAQAAGLCVARRAAGEALASDTAIYVADTLGELGLIYRLGGLAFVGGTYAPVGGQNPIEPAKLGLAVLHGPGVSKSAEVYAAFDAGGGARLVGEPDELGVVATALLADPARLAAMQAKARATAKELGGALARTLEALTPLIAQALERRR